MKKHKRLIIPIVAVLFLVSTILFDTTLPFISGSHTVQAATKVSESNTSKLGKLKSSKVRIYKNIKKLSSYMAAGTSRTDKVYYIKKQAKVGSQTYYLLSMQASATKGVIGWANAKDLAVNTHKTVDNKSKTFILKGSGTGYTRPWGGSKNIQYKSLSSFANQQMTVNLTETVGKTTWYRGKLLNGTVIWVQSSQVNAINKSSTSRLGQLRSNAIIYKTIGNPKTTLKANNYLNNVYYMKQQAKVGNQVYYLISSQPSASKGTIGWVKTEQINSQAHKTVDNKKKTLYVTGTGSAYTKPWGGSKDITYKSLTAYKGKAFSINLTETVGKTTWYRGTLQGKTVWIEQAQLSSKNPQGSSNTSGGQNTSSGKGTPSTPSTPGNTSSSSGQNTANITYTNYNLTFTNALNIQMKAAPQTDKYRNAPAYIHADYVKTNTNKESKINTNGTNLRTTPKLDAKANIKYTVDKDTVVTIIKEVQGDKAYNTTKWYQIQYNNETLYVNSALVTTSSSSVTAAKVNVRSQPNQTSHIFATLPARTELRIVKKSGDWYQINFTTFRNAEKADVEYYLNPKNFQNDEKQKFQFLDLSKPSGATAAQLNNYLKGKGILEGKGAKFIEAAKENGINDLYLLAHSLLETNNGTSELARGVYYKGRLVYNVFGIGAFDGDAINKGAKRAYEEGWFTVDDAITKGATFIGNEYIKGKNSYGIKQNTIYKMRWNPDRAAKNGDDKHQYATDIGWAYKQVNTLYNLYKQLNIQPQHLDVPVYK